MLTGSYLGEPAPLREEMSVSDRLISEINGGRCDAEALLAEYCASLYSRFCTYEEVARITKLDRRTVKKYIQMHSKD